MMEEYKIQEDYTKDITLDSVIADLNIRGFRKTNNLSDEDIDLITKYIEEEMDPVTALIIDCNCDPAGSCFLCR